MSAVGYLGAQKKNADVAGVTAKDYDSTSLSRETPPGATGVAEAGRLAAAGLHPFEELFGGGIHPETSIGTYIGDDLEEATDSVEGHFGGLVPRLKSTVSPGPAGGAAQVRSTWAKGLKRLGL